MKTYQALGKLKNQVLEVIVKVAEPSHVKWHEPTFDCNEWTYLKECLDSNYVSLVGKFVSDLVNFIRAKKYIFSCFINIPSSSNIGLRK